MNIENNPIQENMSNKLDNLPPDVIDQGTASVKCKGK